MTKTSRTVFSWEWSVLCKGCKSPHTFDSLRMLALLKNDLSPQVTLPNTDFSTFRVKCPNTEQVYEYSRDELLVPHGTQPANKSANLSFNWDGEILCKECKHIHPFLDYGKVSDRADLFEFPNNNLMVVRIPCLIDLDKIHAYDESEIMRQPQPPSEKKILELERRLTELEVGAKSAKDAYEIRMTEARNELTKQNSTELESAKKSFQEFVAKTLAESEKQRAYRG